MGAGSWKEGVVGNVERPVLSENEGADDMVIGVEEVGYGTELKQVPVKKIGVTFGTSERPNT